MDPISARAEQQRWTVSADLWDRWAERMADPAARINVPMLDLSGVKPDSMVLDVAAGVGEPSLSLASRLHDGHLISCDLVPSMLAHLRRRAAGRGMSSFDLVGADMTSLPFPAARFDVIFCRFGLMFVPDVQAALLEMRRVLRPGARAVLAVWGPRADNSLFDQLGTLLDTHIGADPDDMLSTLFRFADPAAILALARESGFSMARLEPLHLRQMAAADQPFWRPTLEMGFAQRLASLDAVATQDLHHSIGQQFTRQADETGRVEVRMSVHLILLHA